MIEMTLNCQSIVKSDEFPKGIQGLSSGILKQTSFFLFKCALKHVTTKWSEPLNGRLQEYLTLGRQTREQRILRQYT